MGDDDNFDKELQVFDLKIHASCGWGLAFLVFLWLFFDERENFILLE